MSSRERLRSAANVASPDSLSNRFRSRRFERFEALVEGARRPDASVRVLDIGGTSEFWRQRGWAEREGVELTLANLDDAPLNTSMPGVRQVRGDATDLSQFDDMSFDVVFSNSTIEHLASWHSQVKMAGEVRRLAPVYWVQTPNYWFPVEPHFLTPGWQYLPARLRARLIQRRRFGHRGPAADGRAARLLVEEIRLLTSAERAILFPDGAVVRERVGALTKSLVAIRDGRV